MKLQEKLRRKIKSQQKAFSTFETYWEHVSKFLNFIRRRDGDWVHPSNLGESDVEQWLSWMANDRRVSSSTQNQALQAVCYLYRHVLHRPLVGVNAMRAKRRKYTREIISPEQTYLLLGAMRGLPKLICALQYAGGLRPGEAMALRLKDLNFDRCQLTVRGGKGKKDRIVPFPKSLHKPVRKQMERIKRIHAADVAADNPGVSLPCAIGRQSPSSHLELGWYYLFCSDRLSQCPETGETYRHHRDASNVSRELKRARLSVGILQKITPHSLRHIFATHDIKQIQQWMGHESIETTEIYLHVRQDRFEGLSPGATDAMSGLFSAA